MLLNMFLLIVVIFQTVCRPIQLLGMQEEVEDEFVLINAQGELEDQQVEASNPSKKDSLSQTVCDLSEKEVKRSKRLVDAETQTQEFYQGLENKENQRHRYRTQGLYFGLLVGGLCFLCIIKSKS